MPFATLQEGTLVFCGPGLKGGITKFFGFFCFFKGVYNGLQNLENIRAFFSSR